MKILGIDFGEKRIGLAISDATGKIAIPYGVLTLEIGSVGLSQKIKKICQKEKIGEIVIGLPLNLKGEEGKKAQEVKEFVQELKKEISLPIIFEDERFSTKEAEKILREKGVKSRQTKIDVLSAILILEQYMEKEGV